MKKPFDELIRHVLICFSAIFAMSKKTQKLLKEIKKLTNQTKRQIENLKLQRRLKKV
jgi:hypothetical protein